MNVLCDTTVFVEYLRGNSIISEYLRRQSVISCSIISAAELLQGARNANEIEVIKNLFATITILPITPKVCQLMLTLIEWYARSSGLTIPDALIAATAMTHKLPFVTHNTRHFLFINGLVVHSWNDVLRA